MSASLAASRLAGSAPIRVGVSGLFLENPQNGTGRYTRRVLEQLARASDLEAVAITGQSAWTHPELRQAAQALYDDAASRPASPARTRFVTAPPCPIRLGKYGQKLYWEQVGLRLACWRLGLVCAAARQAAAVVTLSEFSKGEIERLLGLDPARIHVVLPGVEPAFQPEVDPAAIARARDRLALPPQYLLYVGGRDPRKNIGVLLDALALLRREDPLLAAQVPPLVVSAASRGADAPAQFPDWRAQAARHGLGSAVHFVERIAEEDLPAVYRGALAMCFPSRAEGFGLTPLEAMACGTPLVCSDATSLPEAVGDAGILLSPDDTAGWARAMVQVATDSGLRSRLRDRGLARARQFRWEYTGEQVHAIIVQTAGAGQRRAVR